MSGVPFVLSLDSSPYYGHDMFPNRMFRRLHERQHTPLDMHTLGLIARLGAHAHQLSGKRHGDEFFTDARIGPNHFEVHLDVGLFEPHELSVKLINENSIVVEGKHEEREDEHGSVSRHFVRRYNVPKGFDATAIMSTLSTDKVLTVRVPKVSSDEKNSERIVHIQQTGPSDFFLHNNGTESNSKQTENKGT